MLLNLERARQKMEAAGLDALVAALPRNVYYASGFWTRISEWGFAENQAAVVLPRDPAKPATLVLPEFAMAGLLETPTWIPRVRVTEFLDPLPSPWRSGIRIPVSHHLSRRQCLFAALG